jgi:REP element-mobilizing transposase RayT
MTDPRLAAFRRNALDPAATDTHRAVPKTAVDPLHPDGAAAASAFLRNAAKRGVLAYHVIFGAYGFWLPNDPRGSWSDLVAAWELFRAGGRATKVATRRSVAGARHDAQARRQVKEMLKYPPVVFDGRQALSVAQGFARMAAKSGYHIYACSILPEHVHLVLGRHTYRVEQMVRLLKAEASTKLADDGHHPLARWRQADGSLPTPWARKCWKVFLDSVEDLLRAIRYVEENPVKEGKRRQCWSFVVPYARV